MSPSRWIFAYGSLLWRPAFPFEESRLAHVKGWRRRLWQHSVDHRGVPEAAGLVATLVAETDASCVGLAYRVSAPAWDEVLQTLDHREKGGYLREPVGIYWEEPLEAEVQPEIAVVYRADPEGEHFAGPLSDEQVAEKVRTASGPSGHNAEYVLRLAETLHELGVDDAHVFNVANLVMDTEHDDSQIPLPGKKRGGSRERHRARR